MASLPDAHMARRRALVAEFFQVAFGSAAGAEDLEWISDDTTFWDLDQADADEVIDRVSAHYGMTLTATDLGLPLWELLDRLAAERGEADRRP